MVYMFAPTNSQPFGLSAALATYLVGVGLLWAVGRWDRRYLARATSTSPPGTTPALRASLLTMAAGMAYMLVAM